MRINKIGFIFGRRGSGKTYFTINKIIKNHNKKVLIIDTEDHPDYREFPIIEAEKIPFWKSGIYRLITNPEKIKEDALILEKHLYNALLICEDATKYISTKTPRALLNVIYNSKQKNVDVLFQYHGFLHASREILMNANYFTIFKINENIDFYKDKIPSFELVKKTSAEINTAANPYAHKTIEVN